MEEKLQNIRVKLDSLKIQLNRYDKFSVDRKNIQKRIDKLTEEKFRLQRKIK